MDWAVIRESLPLYVDGLRVTLMLLAVSITAGFALSVPLAMARVSPRPWLSKPVWLYTYVIRGTPLLVQLYMIYFGLAQFPAVRESFMWPMLKSAWFCAWFAFAINTTAYTTEIFAGGMQALGRARVFGVQTAGQALPSVPERLPNGDILYHAIADFLNPFGKTLEGAGVTPDTRVPLTRAALLKGRDPAMEAAMEWVRTAGVRQ